MTLTEWLSLAGLCLAGAASPGPSLAVVLAANLRGRQSAGFAAAWAHALGVGLYAALTVVGLGVVVTANPTVFAAVQAVGACYLLWLAFGMWTSDAATAADNEPARAEPSAQALHAARDGFAVSFLNPKLAVFMLALFSQFIKPGAGLWTSALLIGTATLIDGLWYSLVTLTLNRGNWIERLQNNARQIDRGFAALLAAVALVILWRVVSRVL